METSDVRQTPRSSSGIKEIIALYDGVLKFLYRAVQSVEENDELGRRIAVKRVIDILMYLQARLRTDIGGKPAVALSDFYAAMFTMTMEASTLASKEQLHEVIGCVRNVRDAWLMVAREPEAQKLLQRESCSQTGRYDVGVARASDPPPGSVEPPATGSRWPA